MLKKASSLAVIKSLAAHPSILRAGLPLNSFLLQYIRKFKVIDIEGRLIIHSHLPPINSRAYFRFIKEHLLAKTLGPSHAQIAVTNICPQKCRYCYNRDRRGEVLNTKTIIQLIRELKDLGVFWLGLTGGEPLLNPHIIRIVESAGNDCAVKLFTTGSGLTRDMARDLKKAGLFSVSVSLDHWDEETHNRIRGCPDAFQTALNAVRIFRESGLHVGVSSVLSPEMIKNNQVDKFIEFLIQLDIHEAWLSECKPSPMDYWQDDGVITESERTALLELQDRYNREGRITVNYLAHFEGKEHFGCNAGHKMIYIDPFGEISPCVFTPMTFGNVHRQSLKNIYAEMRTFFPSGSSCFMNTNYTLMKKHFRGTVPLSYEDSVCVAKESSFGPYSKFFQLYYRRKN